MSDDGQPTIDKLASEGVSIRKCIASGTDYGNGSGGKSAPKSGAAKPQSALAGLKKGSGY